MTLTLAVLLAAPDYDAARTQLEGRRVQLATLWQRDRPRARREARAALRTHLDEHAFPAWLGTPWNFYGTSTEPGSGTIACGYFVTTVLEQAHVKLDRVTLAQQASAYLVRSVAKASPVEWIRPASSEEAVATMRKRFPGDRVLVVGFDFHAGFVRLRADGSAAFCHASVLGTATVVCEDPLTSEAFVSTLYVAGDALNDGLLDDWLLGRAVPSILPARPRRS